MFNLLWFYPNFFISNLCELNFIYNMVNSFVFYKTLLLIYVVLFLCLLKKNIHKQLFFLYLFYNTCEFYIVKHTQVNNGLINSLAFWHPATLIITLIFFYKNYFFKTIGFYHILISSVIFIILGSWWSAQEILWHGWWNWDGVENTLLCLVLLFFWVSHKKVNFYKKWYLINFNLIFIGLYFYIFNKTSVYKSIHSFSFSLSANLSYYNYFYLNFYSVFFLFKISRYKHLAYYTSFVWFFFYYYIFFFNTNIFSKTDFFLYSNCFIYFFFFKKLNFFYIFLILVLNNFLPATHTFFILCLNFWVLKFNKQIHNLVFFLSCWFFIIFTKKNCFFFYTHSLFSQPYVNFCFLNKNFLNFSTYHCTKVLNIQQIFSSVYKNINYTTVLNYYNLFMLSYLQIVIIFKLINQHWLFFLVTKVVYSKQKPRYNYYTCMYVFKSDLLINQQKYRRVISRVGKFNWCTKSITNTKQSFIFTTNFQTIDLRLYKFLLRKFKKKLLKFNVESYLYLFPNNKTSHKSKNCRMGKGKGLNNRFYFRCKKIRPILIFVNFNFNRFLKLKSYLLKFFSYKIV